MIELNKIYQYNGQHLKCTKLRKSGINTFQVIDEHGNDLIIRNVKNPGQIDDYGIRIIGCGTCKRCGKVFFLNQLFSYVDGNNGAITKNSPNYCKECYKIVYENC